jgi:hypothetical protein
MRIAYHFPRKDNPRTARLVHAVGLGPSGDYVPMMWETYFVDEPDVLAFDFKYVRGRNQTGLNKPCVMTRENLRVLFSLWQERTGTVGFP